MALKGVMQNTVLWRRIWFVARYLLCVFGLGFFLVPLPLGLLAGPRLPVLFCVCVVLGGFVTGAVTARYCPKPQGFYARYWPMLLMTFAPGIATAIGMLFSQGGVYAYWAASGFISPGFALAFFLEALGRGFTVAPLAPVLYALGYSSGFLWQEQRAKDAVAVPKKVYLCTVLLVLSVVGSGGFMLYERSITFVPRSHGFAYAGGFSSVDLRPYRLHNPDTILPRLSAPSTFRVEEEARMPVLDGAEAAFPVYAAFAKASYKALPLQQPPKTSGELPADPYRKIVTFTNTINAFERLVRGNVDIYFGAEPSDKQRAMAAQAGKELVLTPIALEAFVFFVNEDNPVQSLGMDQIRSIYSGGITNWKALGASDARIVAFQRPEGSGSQTIMKKFMADKALMRPLKEQTIAGMGGVVVRTAEYQNMPDAIGYSFRFFVTSMGSKTKVRLLALDGVLPEPEHIKSGAYPYVVPLYAITLKDNPRPEVPEFLRWMQGPQGQELVEKVGYSALKKQ